MVQTSSHDLNTQTIEGYERKIGKLRGNVWLVRRKTFCRQDAVRCPAIAPESFTRNNTHPCQKNFAQEGLKFCGDSIPCRCYIAIYLDRVRL